MEDTSATLLLRLKQDGIPREVAWSDFRKRYAGVIAGFARKMYVPVNEVDDVIQEVMLGFFAAQPRFDYDPERGRFRGYLKTCVVHSISKRTAAANRLPSDGRSVDQIDAADPAVDREWQAIWAREQLARAVEEVRRYYEDNATFQAFHRVAILNEPATTVAAEMQMSLDSVYQAKSRCLAYLRSTIRQIEDEEG